MKIKNHKTILITGGTGGIGSEIVKYLLRKSSYRVIVCGRDLKKFKILENLADKEKGQLTFLKIDFSNPKSIQKALGKIKNVDILINAAAVLWPVKPFVKTDLQEIEKSLRISFWGIIYTCYYLLPILKKSKNAKIINFSGGGGANGRKDHMAYGLSKTALIRFTENLAMENPEIDINIIAPGAHKTNIWCDEKCESEPKKWGNMQELLDFIDFLISKKSNGISGKFLNYRDDWKNGSFTKKAKKDSDFLTLRRIDDFQFTKIK